jgi:glycosyltransferase involved in cell wall biosynthesis
MRPMRIGLLIYGSLDTLSGGYLYDRKLVEYLRAQGDTVEIFSLPWRNYAAHLSDNLTFRLPPGLDILIQDELNHPSLLAANAQRPPYPIVSLVHHLRASEQRPGWQNAFYRVIEKRYLKSVDGFIFNSKTTKGVVSGLIGSGKPALIAYPPTDRFGSGLPESFVAARAVESNPVRILFLGNVIPRKGLHTLLAALGLLSDSKISRFSTAQRQAALETRMLFHLDVVGSLTIDSAYVQAMQKKAAELGIASLVTFHASLDNAPLAEKLKSAHVLVVPSSYEGFGIVYLEGMAFGLPAIGTTAGAASEIISDSETGYLIKPDDAETLSARLQALASDRSLLKRLALNALKRYQQQPTWVETAANIRAFLVEMVS